jgi:peptidyl-prolyl cis-trans isomerase B (cyclophilin B)
VKKAIYLILGMLLAVSLPACSSGGNQANPGTTNSSGGNQVKKNPEVTITMTDGSKINIELYPDKAPNTVNNFIALANSGFYDGLTFHRIIEGFMIQGGDPEGTGRGGPGYYIKGEFAVNGFKQNDLKHTKGVLSMARAGDPYYDSAGSQFFIMVGDYASLDGKYAAFGKVTDEDSMAVCEALSKVPVGGPSDDTPVNPPKIKQVVVNTFGIDYPAPEKIENDD